MGVDIPQVHGYSASDLIGTLKERAPRIALTLAAGQAAMPAVRKARSWLHEHRTYTVKILGTDEIYDDLHAWVLTLLPPSEQRALIAWSSRPTELPNWIRGEHVQQRIAPDLRFRYDGSREQAITIAGHRVKVCVTEWGDVGGTMQGTGKFRPPEIMFTVSTDTGRDALIAEMAKVITQVHRDRRKPAFRMLNKWSDWDRLDELPPRDLASVVLPYGQIERIVADVERFMSREADYVRRCIPWHRGHLYEGPPGTGKTSVARAVAAHLGLDIWYLPLADVAKDSDILAEISKIGPRSMLLLEDVDVFHAMTLRSEAGGDDEEGGTTLSGLLNALDGIGTPHGLFTVMTTNTPDVLDPAMLRPGRVDLTEHFGKAGREETARLLARYYGEPVTADGAWPVEMYPAGVIGICQNQDTLDGALQHLKELGLWSAELIEEVGDVGRGDLPQVHGRVQGPEPDREPLDRGDGVPVEFCP